LEERRYSENAWSIATCHAQCRCVRRHRIHCAKFCEGYLLWTSSLTMLKKVAYSSVCVCVCHSLCLPVCLSVCLSMCLPVCLSQYMSCLRVSCCLSVCLPHVISNWTEALNLRDPLASNNWLENIMISQISKLAVSDAGQC